MRRRAFLAASAAAGHPPRAGPRAGLGTGAAGVPRPTSPAWTDLDHGAGHQEPRLSHLRPDRRVDSSYVPRPQMAEGWEVGEDGRSWTFALRPGLRFHDGEPVRAADCVASIRRWQARDGFGQALAAATDALEALDDRRFRFRLSRPFPLLAPRWASPFVRSASSCRSASPRPTGRQINDPTRQRPLPLPRDGGWPARAPPTPGTRATCPRDEPVSSIAGGRGRARGPTSSGRGSRTQATASGALQGRRAGLLGAAAARPAGVAPGATATWWWQTRDPSGHLRHAALQPPPAALRQCGASAAPCGLAVDRRTTCGGGRRRRAGAPGARCHGFFACNTPLASEAGADLLKSPRDLDGARTSGARRRLRRPKEMVQIAATDSAQINARSAEVTADLLRRLGFDSSSLPPTGAPCCSGGTARSRPGPRRLERVPHLVERGRRSLNPAVEHDDPRPADAAPGSAGPRTRSWSAFAPPGSNSAEPAAQRAAAAALQEQAFRSLPYVPLGYYIQPAAWRRTVTGVFPVPTTVYWNIGKSA